MRLIKYIILVVIISLVLFFGYMKLFNKNFNEVSLELLSTIKRVKGDAVALDQLGDRHTKIITHKLWTDLLKKHVSDSGYVNYQGFIQDQKDLQEYLHILSEYPPGKNWTESEQLAYWINAYNAFTIQLIIDNYPLKSIKDISGGIAMINSPWDLKFFKIADVDFDLNTIEHQILRKQFEEPRIHFAINCASFSCPVLRSEAYEADQLESQLEDQSKIFIQNYSKNIINNERTQLSQIFSWFESDFKESESVSQFIKKYHPQFNETNAIEYLDYNWSLNDTSSNDVN